MIDKIINLSSRHPLMVILATVFLALWGFYALENTPLDAIPDLSDPQVIIYTEWMGRSPDLIEDQITYPLVSAMVSAPNVRDVRGYSMFGMSFIYLIFEEGTDLYWARSRTLESLSKLSAELPAGVTPSLGPDSSGVGWVLEYVLIDESGKNSLEDLRDFHDFKMKYWLAALPGVSEIASLGAFSKEFQIQINPYALAHYGVSLMEISDIIKKSNRDVGARVLEMSEREYFIRGRGYIKTVSDIENIVLKTSSDGAPVTVKDVATVSIVPQIRRGAVDFNGKGEAVSGIVLMRYGYDTATLIAEIKERFAEIQTSLPEGSRIVITYDRSKIILEAVKTLRENLISEMLVVGLIIIVFLWHFRSALVPIITLPIAVLVSFIPMYYLGVSANIMSLGGIAIAIGDMVDSAIVMVDNAHKAILRWEAEGRKQPLADVLINACQEVGRPLFYSLMVIAVAFLPILVLTGQEGRLFKPLAFTKNFSMLFGAVLAITLAPALIQIFLKQHKPLGSNWKNRFGKRILNWFWVGKIHDEDDHPVSRTLFRVYRPVLDFMLMRPRVAIVTSILIMLTTVPVYFSLNQEFMPALNEGDILYMPTTLPGISIENAREWLQQQDKLILSFGEVKTVFGKVGRAETATDPAPLSMVETVIQLKSQSEWPNVYHERWYSSWAPGIIKKILGVVWPEMRPRSWQELVKALDATVKQPGTSNAWVFPIKTRIDMLTTGIRTPLGIKIYGDNLEQNEEIAAKIEMLVKEIKGTRSVIAERSAKGYYLDIAIRRENLSRYGLTVEDVNMLIEGVLGGMELTTLVAGRARYPLTLRLQATFRNDIEKIKNLPITMMKGMVIPLSEIADVMVTRGPTEIKDENGMLTAWVYIDLDSDADMNGYARDLDRVLKQSGLFTKGITYRISGNFEYLERAKEKLTIVIPITIIIILILIYLESFSWIKTSIIFLSLPFSMAGALWFLYFLDYNLSVAVWVGLIALAGIDAATGAVMLLYMDLAYIEAKNAGKLSSIRDLKEAIHEGAVKRIRPEIMTVLTNFIGLMPIMLSSTAAAGADVAKRIAAPLVGGIFTSLVLELLVYPCIFLLWKSRELKMSHIAQGDVD